jgi:tetratricopeptide (TPR) repeat protein
MWKARASVIVLSVSRLTTVWVAVSLVLAATLDVQGRARQPVPPPSASPHSAPLRLGRIVFPTSGPAAAQPAFLRGVAFLHNFEYDEAIAAFREAQHAAPGFVMAYWGEALCYSQPLWFNENVAKARETLARLAPTRAGRAAMAPTSRERGYLDAVEHLFGEGDRQVRLRAYAERMGALHRELPADDEATVLYALALLGTISEGARRPAISLQAGSLASAVLTRNPAHPGAAHYALHAYDDGQHARLGLPAARIYAAMAPVSSHARHMPSHIFLPLGLWDEASAADEASWAASTAWVKQTGRTLAQQDFHSLSWLHYEYLQQGRFAQARALMEPVQYALHEAEAAPAAGAAARGPGETASAEPRAVANNAATGAPSAAGSATGDAGGQGTPREREHEHQSIESEIGRGYGPTALKNELASMRAREVIESGDWTRMQGQGTFDNVDELFALGLSSVKLGDLARADAAAEHLGNASRVLPDRDQREVTAIMASQIAGLLQIARGDPQAGLATLAKTADAEAQRPAPVARPYPIKPAAELFAEALLAAHQPQLAVAQFQRALTRTPRRASALLGLAKSARAAGMPTIASRAARDFLTTWHRADPGRVEAGEARACLASGDR